MRVAVVDFGTNSTRLLVADVGGGGLVEVERMTSVTRLGEGVDATGRLAGDAMERVHAAVEGYRGTIDALGAELVVGVATSAVRDAANGEAFRAELARRHGVETRIITGDEEARLTFLGATIARAGAGAVLVIDIGGGSTELVVGTPGRAPAFSVSTRAGSVRQTERHLTADPPPADEIAALRAEVRRIVEAAAPDPVTRDVAAAIAVAGTPTSLAAIDQDLEPYDPERVHGYRLSRDACERMLARLATLPLAERRAVTGLHPERAPTIVAGAAILVETMLAFGLDMVRVSETDILHGAAMEAASGRFGRPASVSDPAR